MKVFNLRIEQNQREKAAAVADKIMAMGGNLLAPNIPDAHRERSVIFFPGGRTTWRKGWEDLIKIR